MTSFDARERGFEAKFAHDADLAFRVIARRDKLMARWLGTWLDLDEAARTALTNAMLGIANTAQHDERLIVFVENTASAHGRSLPKNELAERLTAFTVQAKAELMDG